MKFSVVGNTTRTYRPLLSLATTHVDRPQNGVNSHDLPGSKVAHLVDAKHIPGKSMRIFFKEKEEIRDNSKN